MKSFQVTIVTIEFFEVMEQTLKLDCSIQPTPEQQIKIDQLLKAFADACTYANEFVKPSITGKNTIQALVYAQLREQFGLSANQAVRVCARVAANRKTAKTKDKPVKEFRPTSADYDARIFSLREKDWTVIATAKAVRTRSVKHPQLHLVNN